MGLGLEKPNSGLDPGETNSGSDLVRAETFQISRNLGLDIDEIVCLLDSQLCSGGWWRLGRGGRSSGGHLVGLGVVGTDKKVKKILLICKEIQSGAVAKSYMRKGFLIYEEMRKCFPIYEEAVIHL